MVGWIIKCFVLLLIELCFRQKRISLWETKNSRFEWKLHVSYSMYEHRGKVKKCNPRRYRGLWRWWMTAFGSCGGDREKWKQLMRNLLSMKRSFFDWLIRWSANKQQDYKLCISRFMQTCYSLLLSFALVLFMPFLRNYTCNFLGIFLRLRRRESSIYLTPHLTEKFA